MKNLATTGTMTNTNDDDKEMTDDASMATRQATNATVNNTVQKPPAANKKQLALKTILNPWKMIPATKGATDKQGGATTMATMETPFKSRCHFKWWNQVTGKVAKTVY